MSPAAQQELDPARVRIRSLGFSFAGTESQVLRTVNLDFAAGELALICGPTGSGKSTLLRCVNGLSPHFTGGTLSGEVFIDDVEVTGAKPHDLAGRVGYVNQQPDRSFVGFTVREELAFGMEQLGFAPELMAERVNEIAKQLGLSAMLDSQPDALSGGQQQRLAIGAALAAGQRVLLLDEPTSALDAAAAEDVIQTLRQLCDQTGVTILLVEHRLERVIEHVDSVTFVFGDGSVTKTSKPGFSQAVQRDYKLVPPFMQLARLLEWPSTPLSIGQAAELWRAKPGPWRVLESRGGGALAIDETNIRVEHRIDRRNSIQAVNDVTLKVQTGTCLGIMGPNGSGKSSLLWRLQELTSAVLVPQQATDLLFGQSLSDEFAAADARANAYIGSTAKIFVQLAGRCDPAMHPRDLSAGQQLALALALQLVRNPSVVLLDEPTRGLDYAAKARLSELLGELSQQGKTIVIASHDVEFLAATVDRVLTLESGRVISDRSATEQFAASGATPSELALVAQTSGLITIDQVVSA